MNFFTAQLGVKWRLAASNHVEFLLKWRQIEAKKLTRIYNIILSRNTIKKVRNLRKLPKLRKFWVQKFREKKGDPKKKMADRGEKN